MGEPLTALDPIHAEAALRELQLAQRLSAGGVYSTARESGTQALVLLAKAMGLTPQAIHVLEMCAIAADEQAQDFETARAATNDFAAADAAAVEDRDAIYSGERDLRTGT